MTPKQLLKELRKQQTAAGYGEASMADFLGIGRAGLWRIYTERRSPRLDVLHRLAGALGYELQLVPTHKRRKA